MAPDQATPSVMDVEDEFLRDLEEYEDCLKEATHSVEQAQRETEIATPFSRQGLERNCRRKEAIGAESPVPLWSFAEQRQPP